MDGSGSPHADGVTRGRSLSPMKAFLVVIALAIVGAGVLLAARAEDQPTPRAVTPTEPSPNLTLSHNAALTRFQALKRLQLRAYRFLSFQLASQAVAPGSPIERRMRREFRQLASDGIRVRPDVRTQSLEVLRNAESEVVIRQTAIVDYRFIDRKGIDVTRGAGRERQVIRWTLRLDQQKWLLHDAVITRAQPLG